MSNANTCVVCGRISSRSVWNTTVNALDGSGFTTTFVACDFHTLNEAQAAIMAAGFNPTTGYQLFNTPASIPESQAS